MVCQQKGLGKGRQLDLNTGCYPHCSAMDGNGEALVNTGPAIPLVCINKLRKGSTHHVGAQLPISGIVRTFQSGQEFTGQEP